MVPKKASTILETPGCTIPDFYLKLSAHLINDKGSSKNYNLPMVLLSLK